MARPTRLWTPFNVYLVSKINPVAAAVSGLRLTVMTGMGGTADFAQDGLSQQSRGAFTVTPWNIGDSSENA